MSALLVVLPLYEASIQAVDLRFTLGAAPASDVDLTAFVRTNSYQAESASRNRKLVTDAWQQDVLSWFPTMIERSQTRELLVIPVEGQGNWLDQAAAWRELIAVRRANGDDPAEDPPAPYPRPPPEATQLRVMTGPGLASRVTVVDGQWPEQLESLPPGGPGAPLPVVLGSDLARTIRRGPGDVFVLRPFVGQADVFEVVVVAAIVDPVDASDKLWGIDDPLSMAYLPQATFDAWLGPLVVDPAEEPWGRSSRGFVDTSVTQRWFVEFEPDSLQLGELAAVRSGVSRFRATLSQESGGEVAAISFLPQLLDRFTTRSVVVGAPILAILALVVGGALYFLVYTAALTLEREGPEIALLRTRGASAWQTVGIHLAQSLIVAISAAMVAPYVARILVGITGRVPPLSDLTGGTPLDVAQLRAIEPFLFAGAAVTFVSMGLAILPIARRGVLELRSLAARPTRSSVWQRYNLDLFAIALSLVILFQLEQRGFINLSGDEATLDPLAIVFPVLLLFTGALTLLRILPWVLRAIGWVMTRSRAMAFALPGWHLERNPVPYGRLALLVWLTTGLGAFALTYANTLDQSFEDRASFEAGADLRLVAEEAGFLTVPDGANGTAVLRTSGAPRQTSRRAEVLAVRPDEFASIVAWRSDFGAQSAADVFLLLRPDGDAPDLGLEMPAGATALRLDGVVVPPTLQEEAESPDEPGRALRLMMKVFDARGRIWTFQADRDLIDTTWATVEVDLGEGLNRGYVSPPEPPLVLHGLWFESTVPGPNAVTGETVLYTGFRAVTPTGEVGLDTALDELRPVNGLMMHRDVSGDAATQARFSSLPAGADPPTAAEIASSALTREGTVTRLEHPTRIRLNPAVPQLRKIPDDLNVLLNRVAASIAGLSPGDSASFSVGNQIFNGTMVGFVGLVPTMTDRRFEGNMIVDIDALSAWLNGPASWSYRTNLSRVDAPDELWLATDSLDSTLRRLTAQLPDEPDFVFSIEGSESGFSSRPVQVGLVAILFVGAATSVVLALAGVTGYVLLAVSRRAREMGILRALGLQRRGVAATFATEQFAVIGLGALIGVLGGTLLMRAMIPFLQLGETARDIEPPVLLSVDWGTLGLYVALVGLMLIFSVVWATRRVSARRMSEVLREVER